MRAQLPRFQTQPSVLEALFKLSIYILKIVKRFAWSSGDHDMVISLACELGTRSLHHLSGNWEGLFDCSQLKRLIDRLSTNFKDKKPPPTDVTHIILEFFESSQWHSEEDASDLLGYFSPGDDNYEKVIKAIMDKSPTSFHPNVLFSVAKQQLDMSKSPTKARSMVKPMNADTFAMVEKALEMLPKLDHSGSHSQLYYSGAQWVESITHNIEWLVQACTTRSPKTIAKDQWFKKMVAAFCLIEECASKSEVLFLLLEKLKDIPHIDKHRSHLGTALMASLITHFNYRLHRISHTSYRTVVNEMHKARIKCKQYLTEGDILFVEKVIPGIKENNHTKRKLMKMIDEDFAL